MTPWTIILTAGLGSYLFRLSTIMLADRITLPMPLQRASQLIAPAALAALAATGVATACTGPTQATAPLAAVAAATIAVLRTRTPHAAILVGMPTLWITSILLPN